jgi:DNA-binding PadR family transcriptional regulator
LRELAATYSYLTEKQIRATLDSLIKDGFLFEKIENENKYDRSKSYQLSANGFILIGEDAFAQMGRWILPNGQNDSPERADDICPNGQMLDYTLCNEVSNDIITKEESEKNAFFGEAEKENGNTSFVEGKKEKLPPNSARPPKKKESKNWADVLNELTPDVRAFIDCTDGRVAWFEWLTYLKEEHRKTWKTAKGEARSIKHLFKLSGGNLQKARDLIEYAALQRWQGLYPIKEQPQSAQAKMPLIYDPKNNEQYRNEKPAF